MVHSTKKRHSWAGKKWMLIIPRKQSNKLSNLLVNNIFTNKLAYRKYSVQDDDIPIFQVGIVFMVQHTEAFFFPMSMPFEVARSVLAIVHLGLQGGIRVASCYQMKFYVTKKVTIHSILSNR